MEKRLIGQQHRREAVLSAAMDVFAERGFQGATVEEIARRALVAKGTPYLYFADKAGLFYAVFERWVEETLAGSEDALKSAHTAKDQLLALALSALDFMETHRQWFPLTLEVWAASGTPALRDRFAEALRSLYSGFRAQVETIVRAGQAAHEFRADVDPAAIAALLTGAVDGLFLQCWFDPKLKARRLIQLFFDALLRGIANPLQGEKS